jgi:hypothetical protein
MPPLGPENGKAPMMSGVIIEINKLCGGGGPGLGPHRKGNSMSRMDELKAEIENLPSEEFAEIFRWLTERDWERWDKEIEADSQAGKLDFLVREAHEEKAKGTLKDL